MWNNSAGGEIDAADDVRRHCKKNFFVLSCIGKRTSEGCDSEVWTVHSERDGEGRVL